MGFDSRICIQSNLWFSLIKNYFIFFYFIKVIGVSATANSLSQYINSVSNNAIHEAFKKQMPMNLHGLSEYPDFLAFCLSIAVTSKKLFFSFKLK
jgi:hypothetical protein